MATDMMCSDGGGVCFPLTPFSLPFTASFCVSPLPRVWLARLGRWLMPGVDGNHVRPGNRRVGYEQPGLAEPEVRHLGPAYLEPVTGLGRALDIVEAHG
jgi:hypothetical protein